MLAVVNPLASSGKSLKRQPYIEQKLRQNGHEVKWCYTSVASEARRAILEAGDRDLDAILVVGGDGTFNKVLPSLIEVDIPVGVVPCGRGNDFVRNLGLPLKFKESINYPLFPDCLTVNLGEINDIPFGSVACIGFDARVNELAQQSVRIPGATSAYLWSIIKALKHLKPLSLEVRIDGYEFETSATMLSIANGACYGGGMKIAPEASPLNDQLEVCIVGEISRSALVRQLPNVYRGKHTTHPAVSMKNGKSITVGGDQCHTVYADGEKITNLPVTCTIGKRKLQVLVPQKNI